MEIHKYRCDSCGILENYPSHEIYVVRNDTRFDKPDRRTQHLCKICAEAMMRNVFHLYWDPQDGTYYAEHNTENQDIQQ